MTLNLDHIALTAARGGIRCYVARLMSGPRLRAGKPDPAQPDPARRPVGSRVEIELGGQRASGDESTSQLDREIVRMAWPVIVSLLLVNAMELLDIAMVGRLGRDSVAAVGYAAQFMHVVVTSLQAISIAAVALMARGIGAGELTRARAVYAATFCFALGLSSLAALGVLVAPRFPLNVLGAEPLVVDVCVPYFQLVICSGVVVALNASFESAQRAQKNTRIPLLAVSVMVSVKITLNCLLIFGVAGCPRLELIGAGIATMAAHCAALLVYLALGRRQLRPSLSALRGQFRVTLDMLRVALPALGERLVMNIALLSYFSILSHGYGGAAIAAYAIGVRLLAFSWIPGLGFSVAAATLVGQALGAGQPARARQAGWRSVRLALAIMALLGVACAFFRGDLASGFTADPAIVKDLTPFLLTLAVAQPFMGVHFTLSGALRGAGDTVTPFLAASVGNWCLRVPLAWWFASRGAGLVWVWGALVGDHVVRCVWATLAFRAGRWARAAEEQLSLGAVQPSAEAR